MSKVILVTGGSSGLGASICSHLASKGYNVYGTSRSFLKDQPTYKFLKMDVGSRTSVESALRLIIEKEGRLDVLINNAGLGMAAPIEEGTEADIEKLFDTNFKGVLNTIQLTLPIFRNQKKGLIINITSIAAEISLPYRGFYCASKAAVEKITEALRMEVKDFGIKACTFQAGDIKTNINANRLTAQLPLSSSYTKVFTRINAEIHADVNNAVEPDYYAKKIYGIINATKIKRTYVEGRFIQRLSRFLSRILPGLWFERILLNHYKL